MDKNILPSNPVSPTGESQSSKAWEELLHRLEGFFLH